MCILHGESAEGRTRAHARVPGARRGRSSAWQRTRRAARGPASLPGDLPCAGRDPCVRRRDVVRARAGLLSAAFGRCQDGRRVGRGRHGDI
ncbi:hypothetical protein IEO21_08053 [Rhodonia placenta]|uniref:Uncharacterized protein n=1 Tax=Rhodonia placenta TaxID=104341 RepID=A0A8H7TZS7_9APHY|nr:hypothetical protein IEO21_08053 [Postia placenta]